ncbi:MAG: right-handed parallel beta-helix repeat-containing protein [Bacteroidota bacterium]|nr:right-handed parallel beta-helix repeat-containing protein [Bacteroidota bacterium]
MRILVSILSIVILATFANAQTNVSGIINKDSTWTTDKSPYIVTGSVTVNAPFILTVDSGVVVRFQSGNSLFVKGTLQARQAVFTSNKDTSGGTPIKGDWAAIYMNSATAILVLDTCVVKFGGGSSTPMIYSNPAITSATLTNCSVLNSNNWGIYLTTTSSATVTNSIISNSSASGVYLSSPAMSVTGTSISNSNGLGLQLNNGTNATVTNCTIASSTNGQGLWIGSTNSTVSDCNISGSSSHGLFIDRGTSTTIHKLSVSYSGGDGMWIGYTTGVAAFVDSSSVTGSLGNGIHIVGNDSIVATTVSDFVNRGVYVQSGSVTLVNCTITDPTKVTLVASSTFPVGLFFEQNTNIKLTNTSITYTQWPIWYDGQASLIFNGTNVFSNNTHNGVYINFSTTNANLVLDTIHIPYVISNYGLTVTSGHTMTIASTNVLKFNSSSLTVNGALYAFAGLGENIYFTTYRDDNLPIPPSDTNADGLATVPQTNNWYGVIFNDASVDASCVMKRCIVNFGGAGNTGGITMYNASPTIDSCNLANNHFGVMMQHVSNPVFTNNTVGSSELVPIAMSFTANPVFNNNIFSNSDNTYDALGLLGGVLTADATLPIRAVFRNNTKSALGAIGIDSISNVVYMMLEQVTIPFGKRLTINKGVVIKAYTASHRIVVQGKLVADATPDSMIVITAARDDNFGRPNDTNKNGNADAPARGEWGGITFESGSDSTSILNYCSIHYGALPYYYYYMNNIYLNGGQITTINLANPTISNCLIDQSIYGVYAYGNSKPSVIGSKFVNSQYTPIAMSVTADPFFSADTFVNSGWTALGIIGEYLGASGTIRQRTVAGYTNIAYVLLADLTINSGTNVTINAGIVIKSNGPGFYVNGGLRAKGTIADSNVIFTSLKDDNWGNPGDVNRDGNATSPAWNDWFGIKFQATSDDVFSLIDSCLINYSSNGVTYTDAGSILSNSTIFKSYNYGIRCENSSTPFVINVTFDGCRLDPIAMSLQSNPTFTNITFSANGSRGIKILDNTLSSNATLAQRNVAGITNIAYILDNLTVNSGAVFTILPGVVIKFTNYYLGIDVNGALVANGTQTENIVFTSLPDDSKGGDTNNDGNGSAPAKGNWRSIDFGASSSDTLNSFKNCDFRYGGGYNFSNEYGIVRVYSTTIKMDSCIISQSATSALGVFGSADPIVRNLQINNIGLTPVTISMFSTPTFSDITSLNVGYMAIGIKPETYSITNTIPVRDFAGYKNITYLLYGTLTVNSGTTITIPEGVVFKDGKWIVNGALVANGTPLEKVIFTDSRDDSYGNPYDTNLDGTLTKPTIGGGSYITFNDVSLDSIGLLQHAIFRYMDGGVDLQQAAPKLLNCTFELNNWGVYLRGVSNPSIDSCTFNNLTYGPIRLSLVSYPISTSGNIISGTTFKAISVLEGETLVQDVTLVKKTFAGITNIPYVFGNYTVANNSILTIDPGVIVKFFPNTSMTVKKGLIAEGKSHPDSTIVFTDLRDDFYGGDTNSDSTVSYPTTYSGAPYYWYPGWYGINFTNESLSPFSRIRNAVIRYAGLQNSGAAITTNSASPSITYCSISNGYNGVVANGSSNPVVNYCDFFQNSNYGINNVNKSFIINAQNNWWGSNTGPTHSGNPGGTGQLVSDAVNYSPFLGAGAMNPISGDVSLNGQVQAFDASLILKYLADGISNPLNTLQLNVADVSALGGVTAFDASLILQYVVGKIGIFPVEYNIKTTPQIKFLKPASIASATISEGFVQRGKEVTVTLSVTGMENAYSTGIELHYNKEQLKPISVTPVGIAAKAMTSQSTANGSIRMMIASADRLESNGDLFQITFEAVNDVKGDVQSEISFEKFLLNETDMKAAASNGVVNIKGKPTSYALNQNYPNPFNPTTTISYQVPEDGQHVNIVIYNITGQIVRTLVNGNYMAGEYSVQWDGVDENGYRVSSGLYFFRMVSNNFVSVKKMLMVK